MSVETLVLKTKQGSNITIEYKNKEFEFEIDNGDLIWFWLDRGQAHLLMLYLQEHLKEQEHWTTELARRAGDD